MRGTAKIKVEIDRRAIEEALRFQLQVRERELLTIKGPCSNKECQLHYAHSGPCDCP